jgi:hypothetical protein
MVIVDLRMYCFQESEPDSLPPPVAFSPPKAPPISAPFVGMFTFTIPQSDPLGPNHWENKSNYIFIFNFNTETLLLPYCTWKMFEMFCVKREEERPCSTWLLIFMAELISLALSAYTIGAKVSLRTTGLSGESPVTMVGSTKKPSRFMTFKKKIFF